MLDENIISTLEQSLRQTRNIQRRMIEELRQVESNADRLRGEIQAMENSAQQTSAAINSILATMRTDSSFAGTSLSNGIDENYEIPKDIRRIPQVENQNNDPNRGNHGGGFSGYNADNQYGYEYADNVRRVPSAAKNIEPVSTRFTDRTITQACTLLLGESRKPLHVNELYNLLVMGGFRFTGNNPTISIAVSLSRNNRFKKVAPGTFDLVMRAAS